MRKVVQFRPQINLALRREKLQLQYFNWRKQPLKKNQEVLRKIKYSKTKLQQQE
jgi:hypothetical protein